MSKPTQLEEEIREMAKLTVFSNRINEIQERNLKMFPLVYFNGVKSVKIAYDFSRNKPAGDAPDTSNSLVEYYLDIDESQDNGSMEKRYDALERSVRNLFWKDTKIEVYFNEKIMYKSKKNV